ncbi:MAG: alpha-galactosidase [Prevotella sp.]|nr:alpha-galactosidase [Prevotella sp.]
MKRKKLFSLLLLASSLTASAWQGEVSITTPHTQMLLHADEGGDLHIAYYGPKTATLQQLRDAGDDLDFAALPAFGTVDMVQLPAIQVQHANGDQNLELTVTDYATVNDGSAIVHTFTLRDKLLPVTVRLFYKAYKEVDVIETWTEIVHQEKRAITLKRYDSGHLTLRQGDVWLTHLHGDWAAEATMVQEPLTSGLKVIRNSDGARNAHIDAPEVMFSLDGRPQEEHGRTIGAALCWSGNYELRINTLLNKHHHFYAGIDPQASEYVLEPKQPFATPHLALAYSEQGMGGVSRTFHRWARTCGMLHRGMQTGDILLNSWEGLYFDINEERMLTMMDDIAKLGGELFVMDDGWFGSKYQRNDDSSTLGDWVVDQKKLPGGLSVLCASAAEKSIKFGIWIEPEAVNTKSELFERHPEWALQTRGRELKLGRGGTQLVLDMTNPEVQDFAFGIVDNLLAGPGISYIKWDANASIQNCGSLHLPMAKQSNLYVDYHLGLLKVLQRIREKYPDVVIQDCASGGGRANYGLLPYFDEFWASDNTDALQRVYIQWGTSLFFPANAMACHINHCPYWNTGGRTIPIKFRCDVAMSGRLGIELQPKDMTDEERLQVQTCFKDYKEIRNVVQTGDLYRLVSPYDHKGVAALMYTEPTPYPSQGEGSLDSSTAESSNSKSNQSPLPSGGVGGGCQGVLFVYKTQNYYNQPLPRIRLAGLDPDKTYTLIEKNVRAYKEPCALSGKQFSGRFLMQVGIEVPLWEDYASRVFILK